MKKLIILGLLAVVLIAGCTSVSNVICTPDWVMAFSDYGSGILTDDLCKSQCYATTESTSYKIEEVTEEICQCKRGALSIPLKDVTTDKCLESCQEKYGESYSMEIFTQVTKTCYCDVNKC